MGLALSVDEQDARLRAECPQFKLVAHGEWVGVWEGTVRPICQTYRIRIVYFSRRMFPGFDLANPILSVFVMDPPIGADPRGTGEPPQHVYRLGCHPDFPRLCIYDPHDDKWRPTEYIVDRIIPWTIKWLFFHEEWVESGVWKGEGRHPEIPECRTQQGQHPVRTAPSSLWWRVAMEQGGVGFVHLDELDEIVDAGACEGRYRLFTEAKNGETAVFRVHFGGDLLQPILVLADHFGARVMVKT